MRWFWKIAILRTQTIVIPDLATYEKAKSLAATDQKKFTHLGYHYDFKRDNYLRKDVLILTHSDQIEGLETLVQSPATQLVFRIAALTEMSPKLLSMLSYKNVVLYQNASLKQIEQLYLESDIYLDINHGGRALAGSAQGFWTISWF